MCKLWVRNIFVVACVACLSVGLWGEDSFSLRLSPGSFTVEEALSGGAAFIPAKTPDDYDYVILGPFNMLAKNGIIESFLFLGSKEEYPPEEIIGFKITPSFSPYEVIENLIKAGFTCEYTSLPTISGSSTDSNSMHYESKWTLYAVKKELPELLFKFVFEQDTLWSYSRGFCIESAWIENISKRNTENATLVEVSIIPQFLTEKEWALDLTMPLSVMNGFNYTTLKPLRKNETVSDPEYWKGFLKQTWDITSREEYFAVFDDICASGQSNSYTELLELLEKNTAFTPIQIALHLNLEEFQCNRMYFVLYTKDWLAERSLRAWDLGRMVIVTRWACGADFISEEEAWQHILPIAKTLRSMYHSREDFLASYIGGRGFFGSSDPWNYMKAVLEATLLEYQKIESRQHLAWDIQGEDLERSGISPATFSTITYTMSNEQKEAQELFDSIASCIAEYQNAEKEHNTVEILYTLSRLRSFLSPYPINGMYPPLYYQTYYSEGVMWMNNEDFEKAFAAFKEVEKVFPQDEKLQELLRNCEEELSTAENSVEAE